jgi:hypothetical protein
MKFRHRLRSHPALTGGADVAHARGPVAVTVSTGARSGCYWGPAKIEPKRAVGG